MFEFMPAKSLSTHLPEEIMAICLFKRKKIGSDSLKLLAVGDLGLSGRVRKEENYKTFRNSIEEFLSLFKSADIVFGNLETPLLGKIKKNSIFAGTIQGAYQISNSGFSILHLANNHIYDYGRPGLNSTLNAILEEKILPLGIFYEKKEKAKIVIIEKKGIRIGFLGSGKTNIVQESGPPYYWEFNEDELVAAIRLNRNKVDVLILSIHIGYMYVDYPHPDHKAMANRLVLEGANLVLLHHAHVLQGVEITPSEGVICYNLGNFLCDWEEGNVKSNVLIKEQREGAVFYFEIDEKGICLAAAIPTVLNDECGVDLARGEKNLGIINRICRISKDLKGDFGSKFVRQLIERNAGLSFAVFLFHLKKRNWELISNMLKEIRFEHFRMLVNFLVGYLRKPFY
jgi:Bacterial capsule synthesis protein PGA_cap